MKSNKLQSWDPVWENIFANQDWGKYPAESLIRFIARNFYKRDRVNTRILEVGCGPGANIWYLAREHFDTYGIDGSKKAIDLAKRRLAIHNLTANLTVGDIISMPYENGYFDGIIDVECLYANNRYNSEFILKEIKRTLKSNGLFYSRTFAEDMFLGNKRTQLGNYEYSNLNEGPLAGKGFVRLIDNKEIKSLYGKYFNVLSIDKMQYTINNGNQLVSEYIIICKNG